MRASSPSRSRRASRSINGRGDGGAVEIALVPAVDAAALFASSLRPDEEEIEAQRTAEEEAVEKANATGESGAAHMSTEYLEYLQQLSKAWQDCPAIEIAFDNLAYAVRNDATIADAKVARAAAARRAKTGAAAASGGVPVAPSASEENTPNLAKAVLHMGLLPVRLAQAAYRAATGVKSDPDETLFALAPCSGVITPGSMTLVLAPPGAGQSQH